MQQHIKFLGQGYLSAITIIYFQEDISLLSENSIYSQKINSNLDPMVGFK
jgi:hypothetical protein